MDPPCTEAAADLGECLSQNAGRLGLAAERIALASIGRDDHTPQKLRDVVGRLSRAVRDGPARDRRQIVVPQFDATLLALLTDVLSRMTPEERPSLHLASLRSPDALGGERFGGLPRLGAALAELNRERPTVFVHAWAPSLREPLGKALGVRVDALPVPPDPRLATIEERTGSVLEIGAFSHALGRVTAHDIAPIVSAARRAGQSADTMRFTLRLSGHGAGTAHHVLREAAASVRILDGPSTEDIAQTIAGLDVLVLPAGTTKPVSLQALHAMAAGSLVLTASQSALEGTDPSRVVRARDGETIGLTIAALAAEIEAVRLAARAARQHTFAAARPARLFAQLFARALTA